MAGVSVATSAPRLCPRFGLPSPEEVYWNAEHEHGEEDPPVRGAAPVAHRERDQDRPLDDAEPDGLGAARERDAELALQGMRQRHARRIRFLSLSVQSE